jgi:short-subunit dehydrogenase
MSVHPGGISTNIAKAARKVSNDDEAYHKALLQKFDSLLRMPPEKAARIIVRGIRRKKRRLLVGWDAALMDKLVRLFPTGYQRIVSNRAYRTQAKVKKELEGK